MELRHLRYFVAVAERGSFNQAAAHLLVAQPSLSRQIRALEHELGETLLVRTQQGVTPTAAGEALLGHARRMLALEAATREIVSQHEAPQELVALGVPPGLPAEWLLRVVGHLGRTIPGCSLDLVEASTARQLLLLREGRLDIGVVHQAPPVGMVAKMLWQEPFGIAVRPGHPLAEAVTHQLSDLDGRRVLIHSREQVPGQQDGLLAATLAAGVHPVWLFAQFVEHAGASAEATRAEIAVVNSHTAAEQLPGWRWGPLHDLSMALTTWTIRRTDSRVIVGEAVAAIATQRLHP